VGRLTLIVGGVRSGKSRLGEELAARTPPVVYLATALPGDAEMARRIAEHRRRREAQPGAWRTVEEPWDAPGSVRSAGDVGCVLLECLPLWLTNLIVGMPGKNGLADADVRESVEDLVRAAEGSRLVVVSGEVGCGILPPNELARRFADLLGEANQRLAAAADEVYQCVAGIPVRIK
jgi:adenosylcobinamide kinase / adenosylcobinamide-phosphate guanylyltransferase